MALFFIIFLMTILVRYRGCWGASICQAGGNGTSGSDFLLEDGSYFLLEDGSFFLLEG